MNDDEQEWSKDQDQLSLAKIEIDSAFHGIVTFPLQIGSNVFEAFSIHKLPIKYMLEFMEVDERGKVPMLLDYLKMCLVNPNDYDSVLELNGEEVLQLIEQWMGRSEQAKSIERAKHEVSEFTYDSSEEWDPEGYED